MKLSQKILAGFILCTLVLVAIAIFAIRNNEKFINTTRWVNHTHEVLQEFDQILIRTVDAETGVRGYVVTGNRVFLEPYKNAWASIDQHIEKVRNLTFDNPAEQKNIDALQKQIRLSENYLEQVIGLREKGFDGSEKLIATGLGKQIMDGIRRIVSNSTDLENKLLAARKLASEEDSLNFSTVFIGLLIVIGIVLIIVFFIISTNLRRLDKAKQESADRNWILTANFKLNEKIRGEQSETELSHSIINQLCSYLNMQIGAIYLLDNGRLNLAGSYAFNLPDQETNAIQLGEGLVGQAAVEKKIILFTDVPDDYIRISSALGNAIPKNLIILPLLQEDMLKGVIEIGSVKEFSALQMEFLTNTGENIAIAISAAQSRRRLKDFLEETQRQAEELEVQQEELKQSNEELLEKTWLLEKSESFLTVQQEELQQTNEELEEKANLLEEQKEQLENAKMDIEQKAHELTVSGKYKSEFLANMSHELRTPLNSILILSQLISENKRKSLSEKEVEYAKNVYNSGTDLLTLINEILDLSKVESGKMELEIEDVKFTEIVADITAMFSEVAKNKSIELVFKLNEKKLKNTIETDKLRLEQIVRNLLSNAFKFTGTNGKVVLSFDKVPASGLVFKNKKLLNAADVVSIAVTDTGIGIAGDKFGIIFEAFQQADGSTKRTYGGTGLGLSISRELANALGGEILLQSEEGKGSTFTLYLPLKFDASIVDPAEPGTSVIATYSETAEKNRNEEKRIYAEDDAIDDRYGLQSGDKIVLIMEDDRVYAEVLLAFARERSFKGIIAYEGNTGLSYARFYKPDAILLDMKLPVVEGADVLKQLKKDPDLRHIPVMVISGYDKKREGMELGAFDFLQKPVSKNNLQHAFDKIGDFINKKLKKLLIVEDNEMQNIAIRELIGNGDVKCYSAHSGSDAYEMILNENFDCMIVDLGLPDMTGFDLMQKIKDNNDLRKLPIIVYTGKDLSKEERNRLNNLAHTVILKTVDSNERLLDETTLFLHRVESHLPKEKQHIIRKLHKTDEVLRNKKVLIVDDDIRNIYALTNAFEENGLICLTAENGKIAMQMLAGQQGIDLVLMDVMMPEMDGYEATKEIRKISKFSKLPVIALTAKAMKGDREKCLDAGMSDYITKPVNIEQLLSLMRVWLYS